MKSTSSPLALPLLRPESETKRSKLIARCEWLWRLWRRIGVRRRTSVLLVAGLALAIGYLFQLRFGFPDPAVHDEFSFLLAADTFAHGRVTNPTHPMWLHFESFHILQKPTYASIYPIAQGLVLGAAQRIFGHPWWGVWLSAGFACGAICWALQQWLPPEWALIGGLFSVRLAYTYWMTSYWGGAIGAAGGALLLGGAARWVRRPRMRPAAVMAIGVAILANTRPYEGAVFSAVVFLWLIWRFFKMPRDARWTGLVRSLLPGAGILCATALFMGYYCWRVTGSPVTFPYQVYFRSYLHRAMFVWQKNRPEPNYNHPMLRKGFIRLERRDSTWKDQIRWKFLEPLELLFPRPALLFLALTPLLLADRRTRPLLLFAGCVFGALALEVVAHPHYAAPGAAACYGVAAGVFRHVRVWRRKRLGPLVAQAAILGMLVWAAAVLPIRFWAMPGFPSDFGTERTRIENQLKLSRGRDLVIVHYSAEHDPFNEWVYNAADIDASPVVWARDSVLPLRKQLVAYFHNRHVWILEPDHTTGPLLYPYVSCADAKGPSYLPSVISACY